ncbi:hypothetical protein [Anaerospora sp.]|uniref:hypothetical protein n=1 Tax=Anaerospora sp. TaxID=1960278 RepID=UPI00289CDD55|nr:hypothetical protein [Anaerospora sp.]
MGIPKCFNFLGCLEVTLVLRDYKTVTGRIVGDVDNDRKKIGDHKKEWDNKKEWDHKEEDKCCNEVDVKVNVEDKADFILIELTRAAESVSLQSIVVDGGFEITWVNVLFPIGSCIAVNVSDIIYVGVNATIDTESFGTLIATTTP